MNLEQLRKKYGRGKEVMTTGGNEMKGRSILNRMFEGTKKVAKVTATVMPATNRKVDRIAERFNARMNDIEMKQQITEVKLAMLAQLMGANLPTDEEIMEALLEEEQEEMEKVEVVETEEVTVVEEKPGVEFYQPEEEETPQVRTSRRRIRRSAPLAE